MCVHVTGRAYVPFVMVQQCSELEEIIEYKQLADELDMLTKLPPNILQQSQQQQQQTTLLQPKQGSTAPYTNNGPFVIEVVTAAGNASKNPDAGE